MLNIGFSQLISSSDFLPSLPHAASVFTKMAAVQHLDLKGNYKNPPKHICLIPVGFWVGNEFKLSVNLMRIK